MSVDREGNAENQSRDKNTNEHGTHRNSSPQDHDNAASMYRKLKSGEPVIAHQGGHHEGSLESVRRVVYKGHQITVKTVYEIEVDGSPMKQPISVLNDGNVHTHVLPNYAFHSTIELIEKLIDRYPESFPMKKNSQGGT